MLTQTHIFVSVALFGKQNAKAVTLAAIFGALLPDTDVWIMIVAEFLRGTTGCETFHFRYLQPPWTSLQAIFNSIPLYGLLLFIGAAAKKMECTKASLLVVFSLSALLHISADFLLHHDDARRHSWPLSDWVFRSPVSYWDPATMANFCGP